MQPIQAYVPKNTLVLLWITVLMFALGIYAYLKKPEVHIDTIIAEEAEEEREKQNAPQYSLHDLRKDHGMFVDQVTPYDQVIKDPTTLTLQERRTYHPPQFKAKSFIQQNEKIWTIELLRAYDEQVIVSILDNADKKHPFQYFRLIKGEDNELFVLTVGRFATEKDAKTLLPRFKQFISGVEPQIRKFEFYKKVVSDRAGDEALVGLGNRKVRQVVLDQLYERPYVPPVVYLPPKPAASFSSGRIVADDPFDALPSLNIEANKPDASSKTPINQPQSTPPSNTVEGSQESKPEVKNTPKPKPQNNEQPSTN